MILGGFARVARPDGPVVRAVAAVVLAASALVPVIASQRSAAALTEPTVSLEDTSAPAGFLPAPNPTPYCESPTYFEFWPGQDSGPWVTSADSSNPAAATLTHTALANVGSNTGASAHWGQRYGTGGEGFAVLSNVMFYTQWVFTDFDVVDEGFALEYWLDDAGSVAPGGGPVGFGGDTAYAFASTGSNQITGTNTIGRNKQGWDLDGRFQVDYLGPVRRVDISRVGSGISGFVAGGGCEPLGVSKQLLAEPVWDPAAASWTATFEIKVVNNLPTEADLADVIAAAVAAAPRSSDVPDSVPTLPIEDLRLVDDMTPLVDHPAVESVVARVSNPTGGLSLAPGYDGLGDAELLAGTDQLAPGQEETVILELEIAAAGTDPSWPGVVELWNQARATGTAGGAQVVDLSDNGADPSPGSDNGNPAGGSGTDDPTPFELSMPPSEIEVTKSVIAGPDLGDDGSFAVSYEIVVENEGGQRLSDLQILDDVEATFGAGAELVTASVTSSGACADDGNPGWGLESTELLAGGAATGVVLEVGAQCVVTLDLVVLPSVRPGCPAGRAFVNTAEAAAVDTTGRLAVDEGDVSFSQPVCASLGVTKELLAEPSIHADGSATVSYRIGVHNVGPVAIHDVSASDDLIAVFGPASEVRSTAVLTGDGCHGAANTSFNGASDVELLAGAPVTGVTLAPGEVCWIGLAARVLPGDVRAGDALPGVFLNSAAARAVDPYGSDLSGISVDGVVPDPDRSGISGVGDPTGVEVNPEAAVTVEKALASAPVNRGDGTFELAYEIVVTNTGEVDLAGLSVVDDLVATFGAETVLSRIRVEAPGWGVNRTYDGRPEGDVELLDGAGVLGPGESVVIFVSFVAEPADVLPATYVNTAVGRAVDPFGRQVRDTSGDLGVGPADVPTPVVLAEGPSLGVAKSVIAQPELAADGTYSMVFRIALVNSGDVELRDVAAVDDLVAVFGPEATIEVRSIEGSGPLEPRADFDGVLQTQLLAADQVLPVGGVAVVDLAVAVVGVAPEVLENTAIASGVSPNGVTVLDLSTSGSDPDPDLDLDPTNNSEPTGIVLPGPDAGLVLAKDFRAGPAENPDGTFDAIFDLHVFNTGDVEMGRLSVVDDLAGQWPGVDISVLSLTGDGLTPNLAYDGIRDTEMLVPGQIIGPGESAVLTLIVRTTRPPGGTLSNSADFGAVDPFGVAVRGSSIRGRTIGESTSSAANAEATPVVFPAGSAATPTGGLLPLTGRDAASDLDIAAAAIVLGLMVAAWGRRSGRSATRGA